MSFGKWWKLFFLVGAGHCRLEGWERWFPCTGAGFHESAAFASQLHWDLQFHGGALEALNRAVTLRFVMQSVCLEVHFCETSRGKFSFYKVWRWKSRGKCLFWKSGVFTFGESLGKMLCWGKECQAKSIEQECQARVKRVKQECPVKSVKQDCPDKSVKKECLAKSVQKECLARVTCQERPTRASSKECSVRVPNKSVKRVCRERGSCQECPAGVSSALSRVCISKSVQRECLTRVSRKSALTRLSSKSARQVYVFKSVLTRVSRKSVLPRVLNKSVKEERPVWQGFQARVSDKRVQQDPIFFIRIDWQECPASAPRQRPKQECPTSVTCEGVLQEV